MLAGNGVQRPSAENVLAHTCSDGRAGFCRFDAHPLVVGGNALPIRFYAGAPLILSTGHRIGAMCAILRMHHCDWLATCVCLTCVLIKRLIAYFNNKHLLQRWDGEQCGSSVAHFPVKRILTGLLTPPRQYPSP